MKVHQGFSNLPKLNNAVLTIGTFDGVHHGHRQILSFITAKAKESGGQSVLLTFHPHPRKVVYPNDKSLQLLTSLEEKITLLEECGIDHLVITPFTIEFSQIDPQEYVEQILVDKLGGSHIVIGYDHKFGLNRQGDIRLLKQYAQNELFELTEIPEQDIDQLKVSSSKIREHLLNGQIEQANKKLTYNFLFTGIVEKGEQIAREFGYPTANLRIDSQDKILPAKGIYAAYCHHKGNKHQAMVYIGDNTTLSKKVRPTIEVNIFAHFNHDLYNEKLKVELLHLVRRDQNFESTSELFFNIDKDKLGVINYFDSIAEYRPKISTVILNWNGDQLLQKYLLSHESAYDSNYELAVIDNASTDNSLDSIKSLSPKIKTVTLDQNHGFARGYNDGLSKINAEYIALVNSDIEGTPGWLEPIIELLDSDHTIGAVQPKILSIRDRSKFEYGGAAGGMIDAFGYPFCRGRIFDQVEVDKNQYDSEVEIFWATGAAMVVRTELFKNAGGFDADFFAHMEEIDFCWRIKNLGYKLMCQPKSVVYHLGGATLDYDNPRKTFLNFRNNWWMLLKNESAGNLIRVIPVRVILDAAAIAQFIVKGNIKSAWAIIRSHVAVLSTISSIRKKRRELNYLKRFSIGAPNLIGKFSILLPYQFYLKGKKRFEEIAK